MNKISLAFMTLFLSLSAAACATTESTAGSERKAAVEEALLKEDGQEIAVSDPDYDPNEIICKTRQKTGTRLGKVRDCRTAEEWRQSMANAQRNIDEFRGVNGVGAQNSQ